MLEKLNDTIYYELVHLPPWVGLWEVRASVLCIEIPDEFFNTDINTEYGLDIILYEGLLTELHIPYIGLPYMYPRGSRVGLIAGRRSRRLWRGAKGPAPSYAARAVGRSRSVSSGTTTGRAPPWWSTRAVTCANTSRTCRYRLAFARTPSLNRVLFVPLEIFPNTVFGVLVSH